MRTRVFSLLLLLLTAAQALAQDLAPVRGRGCATDSYQEVMQQRDPGFEQRRQQALEAVQQALQQQPEGQHLRQVTISIPVVFHVVYSKESENIPDAQVLSQLAVLNEDFRRLNADTTNTPAPFRAFAADTEIEFCLAIVDPQGNPTSGINRTQTTKTSFSYISDQVKASASGGADAWDPTQYLNIWICNLANDELGYSSSPGALPERDGVVLHYRSVGTAPFNKSAWSYNLGRTATHEVGHWLGLKHIWGLGMTCNDSDDIDDTPNQLNETVGCPEGAVTSCRNGPNGNMWQNYMDYTNDACMNLFTRGQAIYMQSVLRSARGSIFNSVACTGELRSRFETAQPQDTLVAAGDQVQFAGSSAGFKPTSWLWHFEGGTPATSTEQNPTIRYTRPGKYRVTLTTSNGNMSHTLEKEEYIYVTAEDLLVYPNPATGFITLEQSAREQVQQVELVNRYGQIVLRQQVQDRVVRMDVRELPAGMYVLRISSTDGLSVKKVSIVK
ncbi:M43 family zinc metalloprotease [Pontibacter roseus]|uniref:M43 family zinc metalloprotease n=1 Tax=Pontibacter roseus TaxID=336989 RepID=UPI00035D4514|nr:M43 family zinc metalloprotease [Pontibacter roseus]